MRWFYCDYHRNVHPENTGCKSVPKDDRSFLIEEGVGIGSFTKAQAECRSLGLPMYDEVTNG